MKSKGKNEKMPFQNLFVVSNDNLLWCFWRYKYNEKGEIGINYGKTAEQINKKSPRNQLGLYNRKNQKSIITFLISFTFKV